MGNLVEKYIGEARGASKYKKEFIKYANEIAVKIAFQMWKNDPVAIETVQGQAKQIQAAIVRVMGAMAQPGSPNYAQLKPFMPKKYNDVLFTNGDGNSYDSEWMSMTDAKQFTIAREAMLQYGKKNGVPLKRSDLSTF